MIEKNMYLLGKFVDGYIMYILTFQDKLDFNFDDIDDNDELDHMKNLQSRAEKYLNIVLREWKSGLKSSKGQKNEREWKNLVFVLRYVIHMITLDLAKFRGLDDTLLQV